MRESGRERVIVSALRSPIGSFMGKLSQFTAPQLGAKILEAVAKSVPLDPKDIDEVIMGCVLTAGIGQAPARQAAKAAGFPNTVGALTINKVCGSSLKAVMLADQMIQAGDAHIVVAGGMESMSQSPYLLPKARAGLRMGHEKLLDSMICDGLWDPYHDFHMGCAGERCAKQSGIDRLTQDAYARKSYERAIASIDKGLFKREIVAIEISTKGGSELFSEDEEPRKGYALIDKMAKLKSAFSDGGSVTAANSSKISDGAAALVIMAADTAKQKNLQPRFRIVGQAQAALAPEDFPVAPVAAVKKLMQKTGIAVNQIDRFEINEAFAVVAEACTRQLEIDPSRVNVRGGAVALGHPIGASGARILVTLLHELEESRLTRGVAAICLGGGEAVAVLVEQL